MKKFLVIGNPIEHSLSPTLHNYWIKNNSINAIYGKKKLNEEYKIKLSNMKDTKEFDGFLQDNNIENGMSKKGTFIFDNEKDYDFAVKIADDYGFDYTN